MGEGWFNTNANNIPLPCFDFASLHNGINHRGHGGKLKGHKGFRYTALEFYPKGCEGRKGFPFAVQGKAG